MKVSIIAAIGRNRELGKNNKLLWHIPEDLKRFKALTSGHPIIMGRKTFESIGRPLPNRSNIVITRDSSFMVQGVEVAHSIQDAVKLAEKKEGGDEVFVIGGGQIYEQAIEQGLVDKIYLTIVDASFDADTFFPDYSEFKKVVFEKESSSEKYKYKFLELER